MVGRGQVDCSLFNGGRTRRTYKRETMYMSTPRRLATADGFFLRPSRRWSKTPRVFGVGRKGEELRKTGRGTEVEMEGRRKGAGIRGRGHCMRGGSTGRRGKDVP